VGHGDRGDFRLAKFIADLPAHAIFGRVKARFVVALAVVACSGGAKEKMEQRMKEQAEADKRKAEAKGSEEQKTAAATAPVVLEAPWEDPSYWKVAADGECPEGIWSLFPEETPGQDKDEKKANAAKRGELAKKLRDATFLVKLKPPEGVKLLDYDAPKGEFPLEMVGALECSDSFGHLTIAWEPAKAIVPGLSAAKAGAEVAQNIWIADPLVFKYPVRSQSEAKEFKEKHRFDLTGRVVFKLGKTQVDKKMFRTSKQTSGSITMGGGNEDWGAGRMIKAEVVAIRIGTDREKTPIVEKRGK
jgi:hypothetical protein